MEQDKTTVLMEFTNSGEAYIIKGVLDSNDIPCFLSNENSPYVGNALSDAFYGVRLHIFEKDKEKAEKLLKDIQSTVEEDENETLS
jgi:hypothetical protein